MTASVFLSIAITMIIVVLGTEACYLWGSDTGECTDETLGEAFRFENMPFCAEKVTYTACVPKVQVLPSSRAFPDGRWTNHTMKKKDAWVFEGFMAHVTERVALEQNVSLRKANRNEYGDVGKIRRRFNKRPDCKNAYKNLFCWINFPRCDKERDLTLPTCRSACENFFKSCGYERGLWRCGKSKFFNGYEPEQPKVDQISGDVQYLRDYFPGQPFRENKYTTGGSELPICTPAITGAAASGLFVNNRIQAVYGIVAVSLTVGGLLLW